MRLPVKRLQRNADLRSTYTIRLELGLILSLLIAISGFKANVQFSDDGEIVQTERQEEVYIEEIIQTKQELKAPPPPKPVIPVEVPNDEVIENELIDIDAELDLDAAIDLPAPPKLPDDVEKYEEEVFIVVEQAPELIGGLAHLQSLITYPEMALLAGIEGRVVVQFIVDKEGNVIDPVVIRGIGGGCDEEAINAVKQVKFKPGRQRGIPVRVRYSLPITFSLKNKK
ncbi:energy transducer TonB [Balneola sp. MJW-20]|uniref:energy transducer TonB n=1 Tax=Gracilimonas aurantiaca TaxID=3234185 RepID=UPI003466287E